MTSLTVDVATDDRVVPVELRSPRHNGESRSNMKGKRNARVFVFPSSDSENDNISKTQDESDRYLAFHEDFGAWFFYEGMPLLTLYPSL